MLVLIVDDSKAMRMLVKRALRQAGYGDVSIAEASNGAEAIEKVRELNPDLVLSDWHMPEMDGINLLENLKNEGTCPKFGFVTSESGPEMRTRAMSSGALFFISKPFTPEVIQESLSSYLG